MPAKTVTVKISSEQGMSVIPVPFDPKATFGKARVPVKVTLNGHTYRSTISMMRGITFIPLRKSHREAAGVKAGQTVRVRIEQDQEKRTVVPPAFFVRALKATPPALERWRELSFTHQREYVEAITNAKKPETRARRLQQAIQAIAARQPKLKSKN